MARTARDTRLETRNARLTLKQRREPYWRIIHEGAALGYRKGSRGGFWIARHYGLDKKRRYVSLGVADDIADANGQTVLTFMQAQEKARAEFKRLNRIELGEGPDGPFTVSQALAAYASGYDRRGGKAKQALQSVIDAHIEPVLGRIDLSRLRRTQVEKWFHDLADRGGRLRTKKGEEAKYRPSPSTDEAKRKRRATANRCLGVLKAALNHAHQANRVPNSDAWSTVRPFRDVAKPVIRYLTEMEAKRLVNACSVEFRPLLKAALLTGCRYGELVALRSNDFNSAAGKLTVRVSKGGKSRHVVLTEEGQRLFASSIAGKGGDDVIFTRANGSAWAKSQQQKPLALACKAASIIPAIRFHDLRHTHGSTLAMKGVPLAVIAAQLGHSDTRMTERHYAHLSPSYVTDTIRANFPDLGISPRENIVTMGTGKTHAD